MKKKKIKKKFFLIELPIYNIDIAISVGQTIQQLRSSLSKIWDEIIWDEGFPEEIPAHAGGMTLRRTVGLFAVPYAIVFPKHPLSKDDFEGHASIAHEAGHVAIEILVSRGIPLTYDTEEAYTYLMGHLSREIYKNL